ncbi:TniB family NTP-binding protein [Microvirga sp. BT688]|uniref:AAA family ATPase n=1 Tax=Microvirga sp. TaxID=1873136 RepID=UPI0016851E27|nr:AAA family ATPase [Microvirga sp.]MBD2746683.1 TniB family NTP-binding protein [Microvirga sp.]
MTSKLENGNTENGTDWSSSNSNDRLSNIGRFIAMTPSLTKSMEFIRSIMSGYRTAPEGEIAFLVGETRAGKTTAVNEIIEEVADKLDGKVVAQNLGDCRETEAIVSVIVETPIGLERPIVKIYVPKGPPTFNLLLNDVLVAFNVRLPRTATFVERQLALGRQLYGQATRLIVFDDTHHICEQGKTAAAYDAADVFKVLAKTGRVQVLCVGLEHTTEIKDANSQVEWLGGEVYHVRPLEITSDPLAALGRFCTTLNKELPFDKGSSLDTPNVFVPLGIFCDGFEGRIAIVVRLTTRYAIEKGYQSLTVEVFAEYLRDRLNVSDAENPFLMSCVDSEEVRTNLVLARRNRIDKAEKRQSKGLETRRAFGARGK